MKHRIFLFVCVLAAAAALCACETGGTDETPQEGTVHFHTFGEWTVTPATCTEKGVRERTCSECGTVQREEQDALGHDFKEIAREEATCEEDGYVQQKCEHCGGTRTLTLSSEGHRWEEKIEVQAKCGQAGEKATVCAVCGARKDVEAIPPLEHLWQERVLQAATCQRTGVMEKTCALCGDVTQEEIPLADHKWGQVQVVEEPTCTSTGLRSAVCETCGAREKEQVIPKKEHSYGEWTREEPTCEETGEKRRSCTVCGAEEKETLPALGHDFDTQFTVDVPPTDTLPGSMSRHCLHKGCSEREEETPIEPLKQETTYTVSLHTTTGGSLPTTSPVSISLLDETGETAAQKYGLSAQFTLSTAVYKVKVEMLPEGYALAKEYEVTPLCPEIDIRVPAHIIMGQDAISYTRYYHVGSVLYDMPVNVIGLNKEDDRKVTLYELFSKYKAVLLNFYFNSCAYCVLEMPAFVEAYNTPTADGTLYGEEVGCMMLSARDPTEDVRRFKRQTNVAYPTYTPVYNIPMTMLSDGWFRRYFTGAESTSGMVTLFPTTLLIDCEGVILSSHVGGLSKQGFIDLMQQGIDRYNAIRAWRESEGLGESAEGDKAATSVRYDVAPSETTVRKRRYV